MLIKLYLGTNVSLESAEELRQRGILEEDETLLAIFDGVLLDENRRRIGGVALSDFVALSDKRVITWARGLFNDTVDSFPWKDVDVAKAETWDPWHGRVMLAFRLPPVVPRSRRIVVKGMASGQSENERLVVSTLDYMPADDVSPMVNMVAWIGDQVVAGTESEHLVRNFTEQFPAPDRQSRAMLFVPQEPALPPPPPTPVRSEKPKKKKNWLQRAFGESEEPLLPDSSNLVRSYESRRSTQPTQPTSMRVADTTELQPTMGQMPSLMVEQPSVYEMSRSIQLFLEAPRRFVRGVQRAGEMMSGATDLVGGLQNPQVRRNAMLGLYHAASQQELENGLLAPMAPVVRAAIRLTESIPTADAQAEAQSQSQTRRLQVKTSAAVRRSPPPQIESVPEATVVPETTPVVVSGPVRRSINVRRVEQPTEEVVVPESPPPVIRSVPAAARVPVRRMVINRSGDGATPPQPSVPVGVSGDE